MALRKIAGPFVHTDLYGLQKNATIDFWCNELDGFLASGYWRRTPTGGGIEYGKGILQLDGTFTPRRSLPYGTEGLPYYDLGQRKIAWYHSTFIEGVTEEFFARGGDWFTLQAPYNPVKVPLALASDGEHSVDLFTRAFLPDRMLLLGHELEGQFYVGPYISKVFSLAYGASTPPAPEHTLLTEVVLGSGVYETWRPNLGSCRFMQSTTPDRTIWIVRTLGSESKAVEYDFIAKKTVGWVRRLGAQPELSYPSGFGGAAPPRIVGYSVKHKVWAVEDIIQGGPEGYLKRLSLFADEAVPANLSNPVALSPTRAGEAVRYRVRLTGADNDPCVGQRVSWTCSALGTVMIPQSTTDANGYAETLVAFPPKFEGPWEGTTISAEVIF